MAWDLGLSGLGLLLIMSLIFGLIAHAAMLLLGQRTTHWLWVVASATYFVAGLFISEVMFGWATEADLQPNFDGLSFDEVLLLGLIPGIIAVLVTWYVTRHSTREAVS